MIPLKLAASLAAAGLAMAGCGTSSEARWVVEDQLYSRFPEQWSVTCVLDSELPKPYGQRGVTREIEVTKQYEETVQQGAPCPDGRLLSTY